MKRAFSLMVAILLLLPIIASSVMAIEDYKIVTEPSCENPTVVLNDANGASYQWYEVTSGEITDKNGKGFEHPILTGKSEYSSEKGWSSAYFGFDSNSARTHFFCELEINDGETIFVDTQGQRFIHFSLHDPSTMQEISCDVAQVANGYVVSNIYAEKVLISCGSYTDEAYIRVEIPTRKTFDKELANETGKTLSSFDFGKSYACIIEYADGTSLTSKIISFTPDITKEPTVKEPTVEINFKDYASFQWYYVEDEEINITNENATEIDGNIMIQEDTRSFYDGENGWTPVTNDKEEPNIYHYYFTVDLKSGETLKLNTDLEADQIVLLDMSKFAILEVSKDGECEVLEDGSYILVATNGNGKSLKASIVKAKEGEKIEGQGSSELTGYEPNKKYICKVSWTKGEATYELLSNAVKMEYEIISEPSSEKPTIEVSFKDYVEKYEWFKGIGKEAEITAENVEIYDGASYSEEQGWQGAETDLGITYFQIELKKSDTVIVTHDANGSSLSDIYFDGEIDIDAISGNDGEYIFEITRDGSYVLVSNPAFDMVNLRVFSINAEMEKTPIKNQSTNTLTEYEIGEYYKAVVTYKDGSVLESEILKMDYAITSQPTKENLTVETNKNEDVLKYNWYLIESLGLYDVVFSGSIKNGMAVPSYIYDGKYIDGKWVDDGGYINLEVTLLDGDILKITPNSEFYGYVGFYGDEEGFEYENGSYIYKANSSTRVDFELDDENENAISATIEVIRNGVAYRVEEISGFDDENGLYYSPDVDDGSYIGEKWESEDETSGGKVIQQIDIEFELEKEYKITVKLSDGFEGDVIIDDMSIDEEQQVEIENGVAIFTNDGDITDLELKIESDNKFFAEIILTYNDKDYIVVGEADFDEELKAYTDVYVNDGVFKDGLWLPDGEDNEIDIELTISKGSVLIVTLSEGFSGNVYLDDLDTEAIYLEGTDGVYKYVATETIYPDLQIDNNGSDFTAKIQIERVGKALLEDKQTKTLIPSKIGKYYCVIAFENGKTLTTDIIEFNSQVIFDTNGGTPLNSVSVLQLTEIEKTERPGFILEGWYLDKELTERAELPLDVVGAITLYAKWTLCNHKDSESKPTCTEDTVCTLCNGEYKSEGHIYGLEYTADTEKHYYSCTVCGNKRNEGEHTFTEWTVVEFPERKKEGKQASVCTVCAYTQARAIEPLGGLTNGAITGIIVGSSALLSALAVGIWFVLKRRML